jgi:uncharacterized protein (TIGR02145 family)
MKKYVISMMFVISMLISSYAQSFKTVKIGNQIWMAENMNIPVPGSWDYNDNKSLGAKYGRLYTWEAAQKVCPSGWRLPTEKDWQQLIEYLGGENIAGKNLKPGGNAGFNAQLGGMSSVGNFLLLNNYGTFWTASSYDNDHAWYFYVTASGQGITKTYFDKRYGFSVRCIKND